VLIIGFHHTLFVHTVKPKFI